MPKRELGFDRLSEIDFPSGLERLALATLFLERFHFSYPLILLFLVPHDQVNLL
jgi:hypothetical protein